MAARHDYKIHWDTLQNLLAHTDPLGYPIATLRRRQERVPDGLGTREFIHLLPLLEHASLTGLVAAVDVQNVDGK